MLLAIVSLNIFTLGYSQQKSTTTPPRSNCRTSRIGSHNSSRTKRIFVIFTCLWISDPVKKQCQWNHFATSHSSSPKTKAKLRNVRGFWLKFPVYNLPIWFIFISNKGYDRVRWIGYEDQLGTWKWVEL